jgi:hypothetical protein
MGTKEILFNTRDMDWGCDTKLYTSHEDFTARFPKSLQSSEIRVLKQYRGNGGDGVYKIQQLPNMNDVRVIHAAGNEHRVLTVDELNHEFNSFFLDNNMLLDQEWNKNIANGMVRCYVSGTKVAGFGYQEINALYESNDGTYLPPGKRYYYTENCGLFADLKDLMEKAWIPELQQRLSLDPYMMPVIWDADFFINHFYGNSIGKYTLCEINVSCVSPFPPSAIRFMVEEVKSRLSANTI